MQRTYLHYLKTKINKKGFVPTVTISIPIPGQYGWDVGGPCPALLGNETISLPISGHRALHTVPPASPEE